MGAKALGALAAGALALRALALGRSALSRLKRYRSWTGVLQLDDRADRNLRMGEKIVAEAIVMLPSKKRARGKP